MDPITSSLVAGGVRAGLGAIGGAPAGPAISGAYGAPVNVGGLTMSSKSAPLYILGAFAMGAAVAWLVRR